MSSMEFKTISTTARKGDVELRQSQIFTDEAKSLTLLDMVKEQPKDRHTLSRGDIIIIYAVFGTLQAFYDSYRQYIVESEAKNWDYIQAPHYYLKSLIG